MDISYGLLTLAVQLSPTREAQRGFCSMYENMVNSGDTEPTIIMALTGRIQDGLAYGNWPTEKANIDLVATRH